MEVLPIDQYRSAIEKLSGNFTLQASPGSGKSTRVPVMLQQAHGGKVIILEPRRMAAKMAALRVAQENGWKLGQEVGYVFRWEKMASNDTLITYFTEGSFIRYLLAHPDLPGVSTILLDEFHERHLETDLAFALLQGMPRKIPLGIMSATLNLGRLEEIWRGETLDIKAPSYELEMHYLDPAESKKPLVKKVVNALLEAWEQAGDILVFLPGMAEIKQVAAEIARDEDFKQATMILHGDISIEEQQAVLAPRAARKIILATNIAESSLTIPGISIVLDSGLQRELVYQPLTQTSHLENRPISQASAIQRAARSNRRGKGICYRLYSEEEFQTWPSFATPEILRSDLTSAYLWASAWPYKMLWPLTPPALAGQTAHQVLKRLRAIDEDGKMTPWGKELTKWPLDPRQSGLMLYACCSSETTANAVINFLAELNAPRGRIDERLRQRLTQRYLQEKNSSRLFALLTPSEQQAAAHWTLEQIIFKAYADHLAQWRPNLKNFIHAQGVVLNAAPSVLDQLAGPEEWWCILDLDGQGRVSKLVAVKKDWAYELEPFPLKEQEVLVFDEAKQSVLCHEEVWLEHLVLERQVRAPRPNQQAEVTKILGKAAQKIENTIWATPAGARLQYIGKVLASDATSSLLDNFAADVWWQEFLGATNVLPADAASYFLAAVESFLAASTPDNLRERFPQELKLGSGRPLKITYTPGEPPFVAAYIQEFYGTSTLPTFKWPQKLVAKLLGPHKRPIQVTSDLASFWQNTYPALHNEWRRNYPHHYWPDDPVHAVPVLLKKHLPPSAAADHKNAGKNSPQTKKKKR